MKVEAKFENKIQNLGKTDRNYCMLSIKAPEIQQSTERKPLNLALVIDKSGSMHGDKIDSVKRAVNHLVQNLTNKDILSIIAYNQKVDTVRHSEYVFNKQEIIASVNALYSSGRTNLSEGWELGFKEISENLSDEYVNRIILLTDGLANEGITNNKELAKLGKKFRKKGVRTTCMGVGDDFNEELLKQIADESSGNYYYMEHAEQIQEMFSEEIGELLNLVAQDIELAVEFKNGVQLRRVLTDYALEKTGEDEYTFSLDDAFSNDEKVILLRLDYPAVHANESYEVCTCKLKYKALLSDEDECIDEFDITREVKAQKACADQVPEEEVLKNIALFLAAEARRQSYHQFKAGKTDTASHTLHTSSAELTGIAHSLEMINSEYSAMIRQESQSLEQDKTDFEATPEKASKSIIFKSRSSFRKKTEYKKRKQEDDGDETDENEDKI